MKVDLAPIIGELASFEGIDGCALVEADTGMAWHYSGQLPEIETIGEAAIEFWRIQARLSDRLGVLGSLNSIAYSFTNRVLALFPCCDEPTLILVCVARKGEISWHEWGAKVVQLRKILVTL